MVAGHKRSGSPKPFTPHEISAAVDMSRLLEALGLGVNLRTRRCACQLHGGSNLSAFAWTDSGLWRCHSCGRGGDRIALVRAARRCSFREAVHFLAEVAGVAYTRPLELKVVSRPLCKKIIDSPYNVIP